MIKDEKICKKLMKEYNINDKLIENDFKIGIEIEKYDINLNQQIKVDYMLAKELSSENLNSVNIIEQDH